MLVGIVNYDVGNLANVINCLHHADSDCKIKLVSNGEEIKSCDKLILPGVGAFGDAIKSLSTRELIKPLNEFVKSGKYMLGICLGMQLLFDKSEEFGMFFGLSLIQGNIYKFKNKNLKSIVFKDDESDAPNALKIPHVGWNKAVKQKDNPLLKDMEDEFFLYFVHSFHAQCHNKFVIAKCDYGISFPAIVNKENIFGIQAHPEKSHANGIKIIKNFLSMN